MTSITYDSILTIIRRINCSELSGAGRFTKEELLADAILAEINLRKPLARDIQTPALPAGMKVISSSSQDPGRV